MKKNIILLYPYKFTDFEYFKFEIEHYKKLGYNVLLVDLSKLLLSERYIKAWKCKRSKHSYAPKSLYSLFFFLKKNKKNSIIFNLFCEHYSFKIVIIFLIIKFLKIKQIYITEEFIKKKKVNIVNKIKWFFIKIKEHKLNFFLYIFYFNYFFFKSIIILLKNKKEIIFSNIKSKNNILINFFDYSNYLLPYKPEKNLRNYFIYLDNGGPYFTGDTYLNSRFVKPVNVRQYYLSLLSFFKKISIDFNCKIVVIPHPKYKSSKKNYSLNPYFSKLYVDNRFNALKILAKNAKFFIAKGSNANSYAVAHNKPIINIYSDDINDSYHTFAIRSVSKLIGNTEYNFKNYSKNNFKEKIKINKVKYKKFLFDYLTHKKTLSLPNFKIISDYIKLHNL